MTSAGPPNHAALIVAIARDDDRAAFVALFDHFAPRLKTWLRRGGAPEDQAEELAQEVMITVWRRAAQFNPSKAAASTWIYTIARNKRIDRFRKERRPELDPNDPLLVPAAPTAPDNALDTSRQSDKIRTAMSGLAPEQAYILERAFFGDMSHSAIAQTLDLPLGTVKSRVRLAMKHLRKALTVEGTT